MANYKKDSAVYEAESTGDWTRLDAPEDRVAEPAPLSEKEEHGAEIWAMLEEFNDYDE